ncbi:MAG: radical SAM protein [Fibrobacterota bacterium]
MKNKFKSILLRLLTYPSAAYNAVLFQLLHNRRLLRPPYRPMVMDIEPTTYCNFKCSMCHVSDSDFPHQHMSFELFKSIIDSNPQLLKIKLQGMGEPLLCPDFFAMVEYARKQHLLVQTTTNGSRLNESNVERLAKAGLISIGVSIDGATADTFEAIRINSSFQKVTEGVKRLSDSLSAHKTSTILRGWTVLQKANSMEIAEIVRLSKALGVHEHVFQVFVSSWGKTAWEAKTSQASIDQELLNKAIQTTTDEGKKVGLSVKFFYENLYSKNRPCIWPWHSAYVAADGRVVPCCILGDPRVKALGDLTKESFLHLWKKENYSSFRNLHIADKIPGFCKSCYRV